MKLVRRGCLAVLLPAVLFMGAAASLLVPYSRFTQDVFLDFPKGASTREMARQLEGAGVIRSQWQFLLTRALRRSSRLQAGEYRFSKADSVWDVYGRIARGDVYYYEFTVPEGNNIFDIAQLLGDAKLASPEKFLKAAKNPALIRDLAPRAESLEGYLFPSTYRVTRQTTPEQICRQMTDQFRRVWRELKPPEGADVNAAVVLASLVEKETGLPAERPTVASVYSNRLRIGMKLDCDPTVIYAALLEDRYRGTIYRSDLDNDNAYNTYRHPGLPPGPIANPGKASLAAVLHPAQTDYLYFVAKPDGSGGHQFSRDFGAHAKAVGAYRRGQK
jgi:UPF0755 protein